MMNRLALILGLLCVLLPPVQVRGQQMRLSVTGGAATFLGEFLETTETGPTIGGVFLFEPPSGPGFGVAVDISTHGREFEVEDPSVEDTRELDVLAVVRLFPGDQAWVFLEARAGFTRQWYDVSPVVADVGGHASSSDSPAFLRHSDNGYAIGPALGALIPSRLLDFELAVQGLYHSYGKARGRGSEKGVRILLRGGFSLTVGG